LAAIDTSASMSDEELGEISAALMELARTHTVTVAECDTMIQRVYRYTKPVKDVQGRGGTSFCPPLAGTFLRKTRADLVIYFTDGAGNAPTKAPQVPVIWVLTPGGDPPAKWGQRVWMAPDSVPEYQ
jgi:predicted metal-dependent peptidase